MTEKVISYLINRGYTSQESAEKLGVSKKTVLRATRRHGLKFTNKPKRYDTIDVKIVRKLVKRGYTGVQISKLLKRNRSSINRVCLKNNIKQDYSVKLNKREKAILIGTLLGDASLSKTIKTRLHCEHGYKQAEYCKWKFEQLYKLKGKYKETTRKTIDERTGIYYKAASFYTLSTCSLNEWYDLLYQDKKIIPEELLKHYNTLSLAIHYMDDGNKNSSTYSLATHCFDKKSLLVFIKMCERKFGISWNINKNHQLYLPVKYRNIFTKLVKPHIHKIMEYKLH